MPGRTPPVNLFDFHRDKIFIISLSCYSQDIRYKYASNLMSYSKTDRTGLIGCAIGTAVISIVAKGLPVNTDNIIYELDRMKASSGHLPVRAITHDAAKLLRKTREG